MTDVAHKVPALAQVTSDQWQQLLEGVGIDDTYLSSGWVQASAYLEPHADNARPVLLHQSGPGGDVVCALLLREAGGGWRDVVSPYGYGGPVAVGDAPPVDAFHAHFAAWARDNSVVSAFYRFHPLFANERLAAPEVEVVELAGTVAWRLHAERDLMADMHSRHRRSCRRAEREGVSVTVEPCPDSLDDFVALYETTMRRQQASDFYFFPDDYWRAFAQRELNAAVVMVNARRDGELVASLMCMVAGRDMHYHLGASADAARDIGASPLCFLTAAHWAQRQGITRFHLGGGVGGGVDDLHGFKHRFDPDSELLPFHIGKQVLDPVGYRELAGTSDTSGFFPAYRRPATAAGS
jgi:CelD/BcsL family acetyltransferase involved in cellulose biosynthesis